MNARAALALIINGWPGPCRHGRWPGERSLVHLAEVFRRADAAGLLRDPELAAARMRQVMAVHGVEG